VVESLRSKKELVFFLFGAPLSLAVLYARTTASVLRFPSDPGYLYVQNAVDSGVNSLLIGDPYYHLAARLLAWLTSFFPLVTQAVVLATLVHLVWAACATIIARVCWLETRSRAVGAVAGLLLVTAPHASESTLGNVGNVKWPLLTTLLVVCASAVSVQNAKWPTFGLMMFTGFTNPLTFLCLFSLGLLARRRVESRVLALRLSGACLVTLLLQLMKVGFSSASDGHSTKVVKPWEGMGLFWWSGLLGPIFLTFALFLAAVVLRFKKQSLSDFGVTLGATALLVGVVSYQMGGIADRYFVAPMTLATLAVMVAIVSIHLNVALKRFVWAVGVVLLMIPSVKWFSTGWFMTSGPTWAQEISRTRELCINSRIKRVAIAVSPSGSEILKCSQLIDG